jgi:putative aminopeptidase FrvX
MSKDKTEYDFLLDYLNTPSPSGMEKQGQSKWMEYIKPYVHKIDTDAYGSAVGVINPEAEFKVVIEAHADEIGWNVCYISDTGYISVNRNGGSDCAIAPSKVVDIHTTNGIVKGVFGQTAIHMRERGEEKVPKTEELFIDVGCSTKDEVEALGIHVGSKITYPDPPFIMNGDKLVGRALDNRVGGYMIAEVARMLHENQDELNFSLHIVNAVQEEVGLRGAEMMSRAIQPDVAIITDVCHDTSTPGIDVRKHGATQIGSGPVIAYAPSIQNNLRDFIIQKADDSSIEFQRLTSSYSSGTDTDAFAYDNGGTPSALIKIPLRYMHTTVETASLEDIKKAIKLIYESVKGLNDKKDFSYF